MGSNDLNQMLAPDGNILEHHFLYLLRRTVDTLKNRSTEWIFNQCCDLIPMGAFDEFGNNADRYLSNFEYWYLHESSEIRQRINSELTEYFSFFESWKEKNPEVIKKEPFAYIDQIFRRGCKVIQKKQAKTNSDKLKVPQIALIHIYEGIQITRENASEIAAKHGYTAINSGEGLFQDYNRYTSLANRKGKPTYCTPKKLKNKIELFESVVDRLSDGNKQRAIDEINILKAIYESEYQ